ncbi:ATP-binding cassette domain-containing protein [Desulfovibrio sp. OttesenSCG-928-A18]|nr:ATP-binding cassette domain-containing protein [Desulfovibrio sp. OttesenSCG-928-A18]
MSGHIPRPDLSARPVVVVKNLGKRFPGMKKPALNDISGEIYPGSITGLVGPDGAGKTTLLRLLVGLLLPDTGTITVAGFDAATEADRIHPITGYMPQKFGLYEDLSVIENLRLYADLRNVLGKERREKFEQLLRFTDLARFQSRLAGKLSGGMKQKLGLACALLGEPKLLLLDEPSVGVDPISRRELWQMVQQLLSGGMSVIWSTSYLDEAEKCDAVILLNEGGVLYDGPPAELLHKVRGRTWRLAGIAQNERRALLMDILAARGVTDAMIQGRSIRIAAKKDADAQGGGIAGDAAISGLDWQRTEPRFEDAFIDMLGGAPLGRSAIGELIREKAPSDKPVIDARALTKRFGDFTAVRDNSFRIRRGEIFGLLGPNGAGKSTTFKMMCGLLQPSSGKAFVMGLDLKKSSSAARSRIGYMAQKFSLYGALSVLQNLKFFSGVYGLSGKIRQQRIELMLSLFNFGNLQHMSAETLPLGFKQRLALACSIMHEPDVLFLDEPTSGVDPVTRREFWLHINAMVQKGVTVMVTTHFMDEAEYCDRIALIYRGVNIATGTPDELKEQVRGAELPDPSLEDAFITLVRQSDAEKEQ